MRFLFLLFALLLATPSLAQVSIENGVLKAPLPLTYEASATTYNVYGFTAVPTDGYHGVYVAAQTKLNPTLPAGGTVARCDLEITLETPTAAEDATVGFTSAAVTLSEMRAVVRGTTPSVTWTLRHGTDRSAAGAEVVTGGTATTSEAGQLISAMDDPTIVANSYVWLETTAQTGTVAELFVAACYTVD